MNNEMINRANDLRNEIQQLEKFLHAPSYFNHHGIWTDMKEKILFYRYNDSYNTEREIELSDEMWETIIDMLELHLHELKKELNDL